METTSIIDSTELQSVFAGNVTHGTSNVTTLSDDADWVSWLMEVKMNALYKAAAFIGANRSYVLCGIGVPCNILSILVLRRTRPLTSAISIMMVLSVLDTFSLLVPALYMLIQPISPASDVGCSIIMTTRYFLQYIPIWLVVLLTLERVVAVCFPMKAARVCTVSNARRSIVILILLDVLICIVHIFMYEQRPRLRGGWSCYVKDKFAAFREHFVVVDGVFFIIIPLVLLCVSNTAIIVKLATSRQIHTATSETSISDENKRQNRSITLMLLAVSLTTVICLVPNIFIGFFGVDNWLINFNVSARSYAGRYLTLEAIMTLTHANNAVNFFLYVLSGRRFRTELYDMITSWFGTRNSPADFNETVDFVIKAYN